VLRFNKALNRGSLLIRLPYN